MTPDLIAVLDTVDALTPRGRSVLHALGEADPGMLATAQIADAAGGHIANYARAMPILCQGRFIRRDARDILGRPVYRLLTRGHDAYAGLLEIERELEGVRARSDRALAQLGAAA